MEACCRKCASTLLHVRPGASACRIRGTESQPISLLIHKHWCNMHKAKMATECVTIRLSLHSSKLPVHPSGECLQSNTSSRADCTSREHLTSESSCTWKKQWCCCSKSGRGADGKKHHGDVLERDRAGLEIAHSASGPRALPERSRATDAAARSSIASTLRTLV
jgi:hypothetical protein